MGLTPVKIVFTLSRIPCEISGSHGDKYEDDIFLEYNAV
jgi:hypothetical protein